MLKVFLLDNFSYLLLFFYNFPGLGVKAFIDKIGLAENLSPTRSNGLVAMVKQMRLYAMAFNLRQNKEN